MARISGEREEMDWGGGMFSISRNAIRGMKKKEMEKGMGWDGGKVSLGAGSS